MRCEHVLLAMGCSTRQIMVGRAHASMGPTGTRAKCHCVVRACSMWLGRAECGKIVRDGVLDRSAGLLA